ncbi:MAG: trypsin-like peptidase domain-containing protein [Anaerovorax sp.]
MDNMDHDEKDLFWEVNKEPKDEIGKGEADEEMKNQGREAEINREMGNQESQPVHGKNKGKMKKGIAIVLILALGAAAGFGGGIAAMYVAPNLIPQAQNNIQIKTDGRANTAEAVAAKVIPSVVGISTKTEVVQQSIFGTQKGEAQGVGTGVIVDEDGYILTNSHVVMDGNTTSITVQLANGKEVPGKVLWNDKTVDLAVIKIEEGNLAVAELGDSENVNIGALAVAIGNPLGLAFDRSVSQGIISGLDRSITVSDSTTGEQVTIDGLMQTDASINSGNSGGPLLDSQGKVIGINTAKAQSGEGMGFAIPINTVKPIVKEIIEKGEFKRAYLGVRGVSVADLIASYPNEKFGASKGAYVVQIYTNSPAAKAGIKEGDIIIGAGEKEVETMSQLISDIYQYRPGDSFDLKIVRDGKTKTVQVTLTEMEQQPQLQP